MLLWIWLAAPRAVALVISEIHYQPAAGESGLEFVELSNPFTTPEDISGYSFSEGIRFVVPPGTILGPRGIAVVCSDLQAFAARYGDRQALGSFEGRLDDDGERLTLLTHAGVVAQSVRYRDRGEWPSVPKGTGHTLSLRALHLDSAEASSWSPSRELDGTPGLPNFPPPVIPVDETVLVGTGHRWRYFKGTQAFSTPPGVWRERAFDDAEWLEGPAAFGFGYAGLGTTLDDMRGAYLSIATRLRFEVGADMLDAAGDFYLAVDFDDGYCAYLNGTELGRANCGPNGEDRAHDARATAQRDAGEEELFRVPRGLVSTGTNVLAIAGYNSSVSGSDFLLAARFLHRRPLGGDATSDLQGVSLNELRRGPTPGDGWVELHNAAPSAADLTGCRLVGESGTHTFPAGTLLAAGGFLVVTEAASSLALTSPEVHLHLARPDGTVLAAAVFDRPPPAGAAVGDTAEARFPDGGPLAWVTRTPTPGAPNQAARVADLVINELFYHPPEKRPGEFIELYNRGAAALDVSGFRFDRGVDFTFPAGSTVGAGGFLVIAESPELLGVHHGYHQALGPYVGQLANEGEAVRLVDRDGNPVDEVRYRDGGEWPLWADGSGSSLELIDPRQEHDAGAAWEASDESAKAPWEELRFAVASYVPAAASELHLYLAEAGACLIDDISVTRAGGPNHVPNPGFEAGTAPWVIQGTHVRSARTVRDHRSGAACLELVSSGRGDTLVNRVEVDTEPALTAGPYDVALWARWQRGGSLLVVHGEWSQGTAHPFSLYGGNPLARGMRLAVPWNLGTPGVENSARRRLRETTGSGNLGPVISGVSRTPASPASGEPWTVTARVLDADGVAAVTLHHAVSGAGDQLQAAPLLDDGQHGDGAAGDGLFGAELPGFTDRTRIVYHLEAVDAAGASRRFPVDAPARTLVFQVQGATGEGADAARIVLDHRSQAELSTRPLHSNDLLSGTFLFNDEEVYQDVGIRYRGSHWGRPGVNSYRVKLPGDRPFRGRKAINIDSSGDEPNEGAVYYLSAHSLTPEAAPPSLTYGYVRAWVNGAPLSLHGLHFPVDRDYMRSWYGDPDSALALKVEGRRLYGDGANPELINLDGASLAYRGGDRESYRDFFIPAIRQSEDEWGPLIELTRVMDPAVTANAAFDEEIEAILDVDRFVHALAPRVMATDGDAFPLGAGHNGYLLYSPADGRWQYLGYDMDHGFGDPNSSLFPIPPDPFVTRLLSRPGPRRNYFRALWELVNGHWSTEVAGPYFDLVRAGSGLNTAPAKTFLSLSRRRAQGLVEPLARVPLRILTNFGAEVTTEAQTIELEGEAPIHVSSLFSLTNGAEAALLEPAWTSPTAWRASFTLPRADNTIELLGFDAAGNLIAAASIAVFSTGYSPTGPAFASLEPDRGPAGGGTAVTLRGDGFASGMQVRFEGVPASDVTVLGPGEARVVTPPARFPLPPGGEVYVELAFGAAERTRVARAFRYDFSDGFIRGDATADGAVDIVDPVAILVHLFRGVPVLCLDAGDADDDGTIDLTDAVRLLEHLFRSGPTPAAPYPVRGGDATPDALDCPGAGA